MRLGIDIHAIGQRKTGNETYVRNLVQGILDMKQEDLSLYLYYTGSPLLPEWNVTFRRLWPNNPVLRIPVSFPIALRADRLDLAHFQYVIPPLTPCRTVVTIHDISFEFHPECFHPVDRKRMQLLIPFSARKSDHVVTVSEYSKKQLVERYRLPSEKVTVTYESIGKQFRVIEDRAQLEAVLRHFSLKTPYILAVGNLQPRKNMPRLIRAFARLRQKGLIEHALVLVGQLAWQGEEILSEIQARGVAPHVVTTGYVSEDHLVALYNGADFFVYPSLYEGFGLPVLEAMSCGTPVITSVTTSLPEVAGDAALYVDPLSDTDIESALLKLASNAELRRTLKNKGFRQAQLFTTKRFAEQTLAIFRKVAD